jgi:hypothetical protein
MKTETVLYFRQSPGELKERLPGHLRFLAKYLKEGLPHEARADLELTPAQLAAVVEWGNTRINGASLLCVAGLYPLYERQELGETYAEFYRGYDYEPPPVLNPSSAFEARWSCTHCDRVDLSQIGPLEVEKISPVADLQLTQTGEVLLASRFVDVARSAGVSVRPLFAQPAFVQLITPPTVKLIKAFPLFAVGRACAGCRRVSYDRSDLPDGKGDAGSTGLTITQAYPLTLQPGSEVLAQSLEVLFWRGYVSTEARHVVGERLDLLSHTSWASGQTIVVIKLALVDTLLAHGARLPALRPVIIPELDTTASA